MHGHAIMFPHDAPDAASFATLLHMMYNLSDHFDKEKIGSFCEKCITVQLLGKEDEIDYLMHKISGTSIVQARPHVVQQWLLVLQRVSSAGYSSDPDVTEMTMELQLLIAELNKHVTENAIKETNQHVVAQDTFEAQSANSNNVNSADSLSYSLLANEQNQDMQQLKQKFQTFVSIAKACNIEVDSHNQYQWASRRSTEPASKFDLPHGQQDLLAGAFPDVFPFGKVYGSQLDLKRNQIRHLLLQYNCHAATCRELLFYLFSEEQKTQNIIGISTAVKAGKLADYQHLHQCPEFKNDLKEAVLRPDGEEAMRVMKKVLPLLNLNTNVTSAFGPGQRTQSIARQLACHKRFGPAGTFVTIAPYMQDDPTALRATFRSDNITSFPASTDDDYLEALKNNSKIIAQNDIVLPVGFRERAKRASKNPVAMAAEYQQLIHNVLENLFGIPPDQCTMGSGRKTVQTGYYKAQFK